MQINKNDIYDPNEYFDNSSAQLTKRAVKQTMPSIVSKQCEHSSNNKANNTEATAKSYFPVPNRVSETVAYRPATSNAYRVPYNLSDPIGVTNYDAQYKDKPVDATAPILPGDNRANKPHPTKEFIFFRFKPTKEETEARAKRAARGDWSVPIHDSIIKGVINYQMRSTYGSDYVNNVNRKREIQERQEKLQMPTTQQHLARKSEREQDLKTRFENRPIPTNQPFSYESHLISPFRFASNIRNRDAAYGIVPSCSAFWHDDMPKLSARAEINQRKSREY